MAISGDILVVPAGQGKAVSLASSGLRLGMLLNLLSYTGQPPTTKKYLCQNVDSAKVEKSCRKQAAVL